MIKKNSQVSGLSNCVVCAITTDRDIIETTFGEKEGSQEFYFSHNIFENSTQHDSEIIKEAVWSRNSGL